MSARVVKLLRRLGSHEVTIALLGATALVVAAGLAFGVEIADWMALPAAGLFVNLLAALVAHGTLRAQPMLFAFHALLAVLVLLIVADRLTMLRGRVEVTEGAMFDPALVEAEAGPLHPWHLDEVVFLQGPFDINYLPGMKRRETVSVVRVPEGNGRWREVAVGDDVPLIVGAYRFYTSFNKGFAPVLSYVDPAGREMVGTVHFPSYPLNDLNQANEWSPPGRVPVQLWLSLPEPIYDEDAPWRFRRPENPVLVVIDGEIRHELRPGGRVRLAGGGELGFVELRSWMGYTISASLFGPWLLAAAVAACLALAAHLFLKMRPARPRLSAALEVGDG